VCKDVNQPDEFVVHLAVGGGSEGDETMSLSVMPEHVLPDSARFAREIPWETAHFSQLFRSLRGTKRELHMVADSVAELKEWIECAKGNDTEGIKARFAKQPSLLDAGFGGIGNTALHWSAARDHIQIVSFLVKSGANLDVRNSSGATPLHSAAANGCVSCVVELLKAGASISCVDDESRTPVVLAQSRERAAKEAVWIWWTLPRHDVGALQKVLCILSATICFLKGGVEQVAQGQEEQRALSEGMAEVVEVLQLQELVLLLRAKRENWTVHNLNNVLSLAGIGMWRHVRQS
jgi:hypothetical protein